MGLGYRKCLNKKKCNFRNGPKTAGKTGEKKIWQNYCHECFGANKYI